MQNKNTKYYVLIMMVYLLGIFMGALDTGIVTPARTVIQKDLMVDDTVGIWMITMYTLAYSASIPIAGKLADMYGRKYVYLTCIFLFGVGSLFCGLSQQFHSFPMLIVSRAIQALGGGGIVPIATAEFGTTVPVEKRGMALGLVGAVFGIANLFGATAGSAILGLFGNTQWQYIFYINIPITLFILIVGSIYLPNTKLTRVKKIDFLGISLLTIMILSLLYGLKNLDFFDLVASVQEVSVYPFLLIVIVSLPLFIWIEKRAEDPVLNLSYFKNKNILITLLLAFITGVILIATIFIPQFSENALKMTSGSGGYFVFVLALFSGVGAPLSGKLIDKYGVKPVLGIGFLATIIGGLYIVFITTLYPTLLNVLMSLILLGFGMGFTIGTPLNYMMLDNTPKEESNSALATLSLIRSIGTAIAPAIMVGFIAHAGASVQTNINQLLPKEVSIPPLPHAEELTTEFNRLKANPNTKEQFANVNIPDLTAFQKIKLDMNSNQATDIPDDLVLLLRNSDVTTIVDNTKTFADYMFTKFTPKTITEINQGLDRGISGLVSALQALDKNITQLEGATAGVSPGVAPNPRAPVVETLKAAKQSLQATLDKMETLKAAIPPSFDTANKTYKAEIENLRAPIEKEFQDTLNQGFKGVYVTLTVSTGIALLLLLLYRENRLKNQPKAKVH
ncbi:MFS transporter [Desulfitobacterium sp. THU1]|uniref:MFS transporter n=1 Tax=Desulfitobacterium sp. THU1 TaxID=3138072 RepID=UPI00311E59D5